MKRTVYGALALALLFVGSSLLTAATTVQGEVVTEGANPGFVDQRVAADAADAGPDQTVLVNAAVQLDGTGSSDADGDPLTYRWAFTAKPTSSTAALGGADTATPTFVADRPGNYDVKLTVNAGQSDSTPDTVRISTTNSAPSADAGPDQTAFVGNTVTLDGTASSDVDGNPITYQWSFTTKPAGSQAVLSAPTASQPSFTVDKPGDYLIQLIVNDGKVDSAPDSVQISTLNSPPVAEAGPDQSVFVNTTVQLDGSQSSDADGDSLPYRWSLLNQPAGSAAVLANDQAVNPSFTVDKPGSYTVQLIVNDGTVDSAPDQIVVSTENSRPVAKAEADQTATVDDTAILDGNGSQDADGDNLSFAWSLIRKPANSTVALTGADTATPSFPPDKAGEYIAQLIVSDGQLDSVPDTALVTVNAAPVNQPPAITSAPVTTATVGQPYSYDVEATDPEGDTLTYSLTVSPSGMTINSTTGLIGWTPDAAGEKPVTVQVTDRKAVPATQSFTVTVAAALVPVPDVVGQTRAAAESGGPATLDGPYTYSYTRDFGASGSGSNTITANLHLQNFHPQALPGHWESVGGTWTVTGSSVLKGSDGCSFEQRTTLNGSGTFGPGAGPLRKAILYGSLDGTKAVLTIAVDATATTTTTYSGGTPENPCPPDTTTTNTGNVFNVVSCPKGVIQIRPGLNVSGSLGSVSITDDGTFAVDFACSDSDLAIVNPGRVTVTGVLTGRSEPPQDPTADAGGPYSPKRGKKVTLNGSKSKTRRGPMKDYEWTFAPLGDCEGVVPRKVTMKGKRVRIVPICSLSATLRVVNADGEDDEETARVLVSPRTAGWKTPFARRTQDGGSGAPNDVPSAVSLGGKDVHFVSGTLGINESDCGPGAPKIACPKPSGRSWLGPGYRSAKVNNPGGPFHDYHYVDSSTLEIKRVEYVSAGILPGSPFFAKNVKLGGDAAGFLNAIRAHEGLGVAAGGTGHSRIIRDEAAKPSGDFRRALEALAADSEDKLKDKADRKIAEIDGRLDAASDDPLPDIWNGTIAVYEAYRDKWHLLPVRVPGFPARP